LATNVDYAHLYQLHHQPGAPAAVAPQSVPTSPAGAPPRAKYRLQPELI
jgi:hypothetical protein